jgi:hypothetical protein
MTRPRGLASKCWGRYDPSPHEGPIAAHIRLVLSETPAPLPDPACDYIEGAEWWEARSTRSTRALQRAFEEQEVACVLYETIGAMLDVGRTPSGQYLIKIQVVRAGQWDVDISLTDAGIFLEEPVEGE